MQRARDRLALMIRQAYKPVNMRASVAEYNYVPQLSNGLVAVYYSPQMRTAVYAYRGTDLKDMSDLEADAQIATGRYRNSGRDIEIQNHARATLRNFTGVSKIIFCGHSLGGREAWEVFYANRRDPRTSWVGFNSAPLGYDFAVYSRFHPDRAKAIRTHTDLISALDYGNSRSVRAIESDPHKLSNFTSPFSMH